MSDAEKGLNRTGYVHIAFSLGSKSAVDELLWIWQKKSNKVSDLNSHIWDQWMVDEDGIYRIYDYESNEWFFRKNEKTPAHSTALNTAEMISRRFVGFLTPFVFTYAFFIRNPSI